jgi:hypothetical protein
MNRSITIGIVIAATAITAAWSLAMSDTPNKPDMRLGGGGAIPVHTVIAW